MRPRFLGRDEGLRSAPASRGLDRQWVFLRRIVSAPATAILLDVLVFLTVAAIVVALAGVAMARVLASRTLGVKIGVLTGRNAPPGNDDAYVQWCDSNDLQPDSAIGS